MATRHPQPFNADGILSVIERLESAVSDLRVVQDGMIERKIDILEVVNAKEMEKGLAKIDAFARAAVQAYHQHRVGSALPEANKD